MASSPKFMRRECGIICLTSTPPPEMRIRQRLSPKTTKILELPSEESTTKAMPVVKCRVSVAREVLGDDSTPIRPPLCKIGQVKQKSRRFTFMADYSPVPCPQRFFIQHHEQPSPSSNFILLGCRMLRKLRRHSWRLIRNKIGKFEKRSTQGYCVGYGYGDEYGYN